jgi:hypothetical protein
LDAFFQFVCLIGIHLHLPSPDKPELKRTI